MVRDRLEEHRIVRRANAMLLVDKGWSYADVAEALFLDDSTVRAWLKEFQEGGRRGDRPVRSEGRRKPDVAPPTRRIVRLGCRDAAAVDTEIGQFILERFGFDYGRSGLIKLMNRGGFDWKKPESAPGRIDAAVQQKFIDAHEDLRNSLGPDEAVVHVDAVHPTSQSKPAGHRRTC